MQTKCRTPAEEAQCVVLWLHGGCFTRGDETWSRRMATHLCGLGAIVYTADYPQGPTNPWPRGRDELVALYESLRTQHAPLPVHIGGESSGTYFALAVARAVQAPRCVCLCPVLDPAARASSLPSAKRKMQERYFAASAAPAAPQETAEYKGSLTICCAADDWPVLGCKVVEIDGTHQLQCTNPTDRALSAVAHGFGLFVE